MTPEAQRILEVFRERGLKAGSMIHPAEFGDAIVWEDGFIRDEPVREAVGWLTDNGYLIEYNAAFELTPEGEAHLYGQQPKHGARVYGFGDGVILVKQTVLRGNPPEYVIDGDKERHVDPLDDAALAQAVRDAVAGQI